MTVWYETVVVSEEPDDETVAELDPVIGGQGNVPTETFRASQRLGTKDNRIFAAATGDHGSWAVHSTAAMLITERPRG